MIIPVLFGVSVVIFFTLRVIPGDVAQTILGTSATEESLAALRNKFGLNMPLYEQYFTWMSGVLVGDFGVSMRTGAEILPEILSRFAITFELTILAAFISWDYCYSTRHYCWGETEYKNGLLRSDHFLIRCVRSKLCVGNNLNLSSVT